MPPIEHSRSHVERPTQKEVISGQNEFHSARRNSPWVCRREFSFPISFTRRIGCVLGSNRMRAGLHRGSAGAYSPKHRMRFWDGRIKFIYCLSYSLHTSLQEKIYVKNDSARQPAGKMNNLFRQQERKLNLLQLKHRLFTLHTTTNQLHQDFGGRM